VGDPELAEVGLLKPLVGLVKLLVGPVVTGLAPEPAELAAPAEPDAPAELDAAEPSPGGDAAPAVVGVSPAAAEPVMPFEVAAPEVAAPEVGAPDAAVPEAVGLFAKLDVTGLVAPDGAEAPAPPLATVFGVATPVDIWITGTGPVENLSDPVAVTPLPSTLYISR
jgi:hypothetical protein